MSVKEATPQVTMTLRKFKMQWVGDNKIIVLIGPRTRGKSTILLDYLYYNQDIPFCTCIAPTDVFNSTYGHHIPSRFIFSKYTPELLEKFLKRQHDLKGKKQAAKMGYGDVRYKDVDCRGLLIMDDCLADSKGKTSGTGWKNDPNIRWIFMNGRHADITFVLTMQYQVGIPPDFRVNIDWAFLCRETKKIEKEKLLKYYAGIFPDFKMFNQIFNKCTKEKRCMVISCLSESDKIEDQIFWYLADLHDNFRICYNEFWKDNEKYLRKRMLLFDPTKMDDQQQPKDVQDDYYKYAGSRKVRYNLDMSEQDLASPDGSEGSYSQRGTQSNYSGQGLGGYSGYDDMNNYTGVGQYGR